MKNINEIAQLIKKKKVLFLAGHFPLLSQGKKSVFGIYQELNGTKLETQRDIAQRSPYMGEFPMETLKAGAELLSRNDNEDSKILMLVNDHQYINKIESGSGKFNPYRDYFYKNNPEIPPSYEFELALRNLCPNNIWKPPTKLTYHSNERYVSEQLLRNRFKNGKHYASCNLEHGCAKEFYPLLEEVKAAKFEIMVNFCPSSCTKPISQSSKIFREMDQEGQELQIINIFLNGALPIDKMWENTSIDLSQF